jgi:hypothetical protein
MFSTNVENSIRTERGGMVKNSRIRISQRWGCRLWVGNGIFDDLTASSVRLRAVCKFNLRLEDLAVAHESAFSDYSLYDCARGSRLQFSIGGIAIRRNMLVAMRSDAQNFVKSLVEQIYGDIDRLETQIVLNQQEEPLVVPPLLSIQNKLREFLRLVEEESVTLEEQP